MLHICSPFSHVDFHICRIYVKSCIHFTYILVIQFVDVNICHIYAHISTYMWRNQIYVSYMSHICDINADLVRVSDRAIIQFPYECWKYHFNIKHKLA